MARRRDGSLLDPVTRMVRDHFVLRFGEAAEQAWATPEGAGAWCDALAALSRAQVRSGLRHYFHADDKTIPSPAEFAAACRSMRPFRYRNPDRVANGVRQISEIKQRAGGRHT